MQRILSATVILAALAAPAPAQSDPVDPGKDPGLSALIWTQHAAERRALCRMVFNSARASLKEALNDSEWTAAVEQCGQPGLTDLPKAIIVDVDETVLDNSPHQARLALDGARFDADRTWTPWVKERQAAAIPGAVAFLCDAARRGITVFYVTNRDHQIEDDTRANLARLGFPLADDMVGDVVLTLREQEDWGPDKTTRRRHVAASHRILMLFGDDLGDFLPGVRPTQDLRQNTPESLRRHGATLEAERADRVDDFDAWLGTRWFVLPNVLYGSGIDVAKLSVTTISAGENQDAQGGRRTVGYDYRTLLLDKRVELRPQTGVTIGR